MNLKNDYKHKCEKYFGKIKLLIGGNLEIDISSKYTYIGRGINDFRSEIDLIASGISTFRSASILGNNELLYLPQGIIMEYDKANIRTKLCENVYCKFDCSTSLSDTSASRNRFTSHESCEKIIPTNGDFGDNKFYKSLDEMVSDRHNSNFNNLNLYKSNLYNEIIIKNISKEDVKYFYISAYKIPSPRERNMYFVGYRQLYHNLQKIRDGQEYFNQKFSVILPIVFYNNQENKLVIISKNLIKIKDYSFTENENDPIGYVRKDSLLVIGNQKIHELLDRKIQYILSTKTPEDSSNYYQFDDFDYIFNLDFTSNTFDITNEMAAKYGVNKNEYSRIKSIEIKNFLAEPFVFNSSIDKTIQNPDPDGEVWIENPDYSLENVERERREYQQQWDEKKKMYLEEDSKKTYEEYQNVLRKIYMENMIDSDKIKRNISEIRTLLTLHAIKSHKTLTDEAKRLIEKLKDTKYYSQFSSSVAPNVIAEDILYTKFKEFTLSVLNFIKDIVVSV